jgi:aryl-alcohol dehydrogenase-like predicted oxidoreductase
MQIEEALRALDTLIRDGKIRYWGVSNFLGWRIARSSATRCELGMPAPAACQPHYNLLKSHAEVEILPACLPLRPGRRARTARSRAGC